MRLIPLIVALLVALPNFLVAQERIALVIGNSAYTSVTPLENASNDAKLMASSLETVGFDVTLLQNASRIELSRTIADFGRRLRASGPETVGLFYYAGHGVQSFGANYLLPVDANLTDAADLDLVSLDAASVLRQMASARNRTNIVILDACRNNPFATTLDLNDNGLAKMNAPTGTFLAYATSPGAVALDGTDQNSPFTQALARSIQAENQPIEQVFKAVRNEVISMTEGFQTPWDTSSLTQDFVFKVGKQLTGEEVAEQQLWRSVEQSSDPVQLMLFLRSYPTGLFAADARELLAQSLAAELNPSIPEPEPQPEPEPTRTAAPDTEMALMETAQSSGALADYEAYINAYPDGLFAELVRIEIAAIHAKNSTDPEPPIKTASAPEEPDPVTSSGILGPVFFDMPMTTGAPEIVGRTIAQAVEGQPLYAPIEGIPEELWKNQQCSNCHKWTREALCNQGNTYVTQSAARALAKEHPYGGTFKQYLRVWAEGDCR